MFPSLILMTLLATASTAAPQSPVPGAGLTLQQFVDRQTARIMAADSDGDGRVSRAELSAMDHRGKRDPMRMFDRFDTNRDNFLDKAELTAGYTRRFQHMDRNGDGVLTPDERIAHGQGHEPQQADADDPPPAPRP